MRLLVCTVALCFGAGLVGITGAMQPVAGAAVVPTAARQQLGRLLFFEPALSINGKRSCASCHRPEKAFTDHRGTSRALRFAGNLSRNSPTLLNAADQTSFFHDGRAGSLAAVIESVLTNPDEFNSTYTLTTERLRGSAEYRRLFRQAFRAPIAAATINAALGAYLRSLTAVHSPYDQALAGGPALPVAAVAGAALFAGDGRCAACHAGPQFRDGQRHEVAPGQWRKTPTLRNVAVTMPYLADGSRATLHAVLTDNFHRTQPRRPLAPAELDDLTAFLETLTDTTSADHTVPPSLPLLPALPERVVGGLY